MNSTNWDAIVDSQFGGPVGPGVLPTTSGKYIYVHHTGRSNSAGRSARLPVVTTIDAAIGKTRAAKGDVVVVLPGHAETITGAAGIALDVASTVVIGLGTGNARPVVTISSTDNSGTITQSGNNTVLKNIVVVTNDDGLTNAIVVSGDNCITDIEHQDTSSAVEAATVVRGDTANNWKLRLKHIGFTAGNAMVSAVRLDDCDNVAIDIDGYGVLTTAWVEMVDVASTNVSVRGRVYTSGITNFTRDVVDTITGSTWDAIIFDASAGAQVAGGSGAALAVDDVSAVASAVAVIDGFHDVPTADVTTNSQMRDAIGNKTDASVTTVGTTKTIMAYAKGAIDQTTVPSPDSSSNGNVSHAVGNKTDAAVATVGTTSSLMAYIKGLTNTAYALPRCVEKSDGSVTSGTDDLFTITGGPIDILEIVGIVATQIGAGTTNVKLQITTTDPAATVDMNAGAVDIDADAVGTSYRQINTTAVLTPVTAGFVMKGNAFATNDTPFLAPIGTIKLNSDATRAGVIKWYMRYVPLSPNSRVTAAA